MCDFCDKSGFDSNISATAEDGTILMVNACPNCMAEITDKKEWFQLFKPLETTRPIDFYSDVSGWRVGVPVTFMDTFQGQHFTLTLRELDRFLGHALLPNEYLFFRKTHEKMNYYLHDDFYDEFTGYAFQPIREEDYRKNLRNYARDLSDQATDIRDHLKMLRKIYKEMEEELR